MGESHINRWSLLTLPNIWPIGTQAILRRNGFGARGRHRSLVKVLALVAISITLSPSVSLAEEEPIDRSWKFSGGVSLLPGSDGESQVGYGLTLSRAFTRRTSFGAEVTSSLGGNSGNAGSTRIHTLVGGFISHSLYQASGISVSAGLSGGVAFASVRELDANVETDSTEAFPYVEPKLSASLSIPDSSSRFSGSIGWTTLPGEGFSEPRFSFGYSF